MAALDAWLCFEDEAGFSMTPPTARTWARRGRTPVIRVRGRSQRRFSVAALACYKQGERSRLIYRPKRHVDHKRGGRRSFTWTDYRDLLIAAHQQLGAPMVLVWDNLKSAAHWLRATTGAGGQAQGRTVGERWPERGKRGPDGLQPGGPRRRW